MSMATPQASSYFEVLVTFLMGYDHRVSQEEASGLVRSHKCKNCRRPYTELLRHSQRLIFIKDSRGAIHNLCPVCAKVMREDDIDAVEIDISTTKDDAVRKAVFGILVGELRHTRYAGEPGVKTDSSIQRNEEPDGGSQGRKPGFIRPHPARRGMAFANR